MTDTEDEGKRGVFILPLENTRQWIGESLWKEGRGLAMIIMGWRLLVRILYPSVGTYHDRKDLASSKVSRV